MFVAVKWIASYLLGIILSKLADKVTTPSKAQCDRFLKRSNFISTDDLKQKILKFISYYNRTFAQPFLWKFPGYSEAP
jgi:hypothetical protein